MMSGQYDLQIDFIAGAVGAIASVYIGQPLDTLKVKMQTFPALYPTLPICFTRTIRNEGVVRGLYAGVVPSLAANVAENAILFASYGACQKLVARTTGVSRVEDLGVFANGVSGFLAAFWSSLALCPTELVKCRLQTMRESHAASTHTGTFDVIRDIIKREGVSGLYRGLGATLCREMPGYFFFFFAYEWSRELLTPAGKSKDEIGSVRTIVSGGVAGAALWTAMFPVDVAKSRIQVIGVNTPMLRLIKQIYVKEGVAALYNGLGPTVLRTFPATGALFFTYEYAKKYMHAFTAN